jgi:hypothetical protein
MSPQVKNAKPTLLLQPSGIFLSYQVAPFSVNVSTIQ